MRFKTTWILLAVAAVAAGYFFLIEQPRHTKKVAELARADMLTHIRGEDVISIAIRRPESTIEFTKNAGEWWMSKPVHEKADLASLNILLRTLVTLEIDQRYPADKTNLATYGLANPPIALTMSTQRGESLAVDVGDFSINKAQCYAKVRGTDEVLLVHAGIRRYGFRDASFFRNKKVFDFAADNVSSVEISNKDHSFLWKRMLPEHWVLVAQAEPTRNIIDVGHSIAGDTEVITNVLSELRAMRVTRNVSDDADDFENYFRDITGTIALTIVDQPDHVTYVFAQGQDSEECLVTVKNDPRIMAIGRSILANFRKTLSDFRDRRVLHFDRANVTRISLEGPNVLTTIVRRDDAWTFNNPALGELDRSEVSKLVVALMDLKYKEIIEEKITEPRPHGLDSPVYRLSLYAGDDVLDQFDTGDRIQPGAEVFITSHSSPCLGKVDSESLEILKDIFENFTAE